MSARMVALGAAALLACVIATGCAEPRSSDDPVSATDVGPNSGQEDATRELLVLGRSVMTGWMAHWGGDSATPATWEGYTITFREIDGPPGIGASAAAAIREAPAGSAVLYKFCFVDFNGGEYAEELDAYRVDLELVADAAARADVRLIIGTSLPKVAADTTEDLVAEHHAFGEMVEDLAAERRDAGQDVVVLDLNGVLADEEGALDSRYAVARDDSHLNEEAYLALDSALLPLLGR